MSLPDEVRTNAWTGSEAAHGRLADTARGWGSRSGLTRAQAPLAFGAPADETDWRATDVGYGILLPEPADPSLGHEERAAGLDAPAPVRELLAARPGTVVLRWRPDLEERKLRRYFPDGSFQDPAIGLTDFGTERDHLPRYVLIVGGPDEIPWSVQYALCLRHAVGRLPFTDERLANYVTAMLGEWSEGPADTGAALLWTVDHGGGDITSLMRLVLADRLYDRLEGTLPRLSRITDAAATGDALIAGLRAQAPVLVATSSHGMTGPLEDAVATRAGLGQPVDVAHAMVPLDAFVQAMPGGAVWFSQACCSAGCDGVSHYAGLLAEGSSVHGTVTALAGLGPTVAPAPLALLGRPSPVRAVFGHVEPTFDWTLRVAETGQPLGELVVAALSTNLFFGRPVGLILEEYREGIGVLLASWAERREKLARGCTGLRDLLTELRLTAIDRQSLVLLGDPTVAVPRLATL